MTVLYTTSTEAANLWTSLTVEEAELVKERTGVPYVSFDGDQADPRAFSPAQYETRFQALTEIMEQNKQEAAN